VAAGMSVVLSGFAIWFLAITNKAIDLPIKHLVKAVIPALASSGVMYLALFLFLRWTATTQFGTYGILSTSVCLGAAVYVLCMLIFFLETSKRFISQCRQTFASIGLSSRLGRMRLQKPKPIL
jgi:ABC-type tungstate transport system substrate-binding protein